MNTRSEIASNLFAQKKASQSAKNQQSVDLQVTQELMRLARNPREALAKLANSTNSKAAFLTGEKPLKMGAEYRAAQRTLNKLAAESQKDKSGSKKSVPPDAK
jgi:hypothetical protein